MASCPSLEGARGPAVTGTPLPQCCQTLLSHRVDPALRDEDGYTAADLAEYHGHRDCAQYLRDSTRPVSLRVPIPPEGWVTGPCGADGRVAGELAAYAVSSARRKGLGTTELVLGPGRWQGLGQGRGYSWDQGWTLAEVMSCGPRLWPGLLLGDAVRLRTRWGGEQGLHPGEETLSRPAPYDPDGKSPPPHPPPHPASGLQGQGSHVPQP